jgi:hypothetical protein
MKWPWSKKAAPKPDALVTMLSMTKEQLEELTKGDDWIHGTVTPLDVSQMSPPTPARIDVPSETKSPGTIPCDAYLDVDSGPTFDGHGFRIEHCWRLHCCFVDMPYGGHNLSPHKGRHLAHLFVDGFGYRFEW